MNVTSVTQNEISVVIAHLQKQKEELIFIYRTAITNEKLHEVKTIYLNLKDVDRKLSDLQRVSISF